MPPVNDNFADATELVGKNGSMVVSNIGATEDTGDPWGGPSIWFKWTAPTSYFATFGLEDADFDYYLVLYADAATLGDAEELAYATTLGFNRRWAQWQVEAGQTYYLGLTSFDGEGTGTLHWSRRTGSYSPWTEVDPVPYAGLRKNIIVQANNNGFSTSDWDGIWDDILNGTTAAGATFHSQAEAFTTFIYGVWELQLISGFGHSVVGYHTNTTIAYGTTTNQFGVIDEGWPQQWKDRPSDFANLTALVQDVDYERIPDRFVDWETYIGPNGVPTADGRLTDVAPTGVSLSHHAYVEYESIPRSNSHLVPGGHITLVPTQSEAIGGVSGDGTFHVEYVEPAIPYIDVGDPRDRWLESMIPGVLITDLVTTLPGTATTGISGGFDADWPVKEALDDDDVLTVRVIPEEYNIDSVPTPVPTVGNEMVRRSVVATIASTVDIQFPRIRWWTGEWEADSVCPPRLAAVCRITSERVRTH